ncbi:sensor histidine kinase [Bacillus tuaregi]|uniref:sensor histidine kinase n=1 Tax=Bacillus tuaregi TaxID=1816695 RepID=UPI0008F951E7|nr:HAMP domain-containing sensor histidine kinase [Bacillus tuaregi]
MLESLLLNFLILLLPVLAYLIFFEDRFYQYVLRMPVVVLLAAISMVLSMSFPIHLESGFIFDLRLIPLIMVALYGGYKYAFILYLVLISYRCLIIGGDGSIQAFLYNTALFPFITLWSNKFRQLEPRSRICLAGVIAFFSILFYLITLAPQIPLNQEFWLLVIHSLTTYFFMTIILMFLIEKIIANVKAREAFLHTERFHIISELSASVAHEIRNPLTVTNGFLQLLRESNEIPQKEKEYIHFSLQELNRAEQIVSDFLAFSKPQSENMVLSNFKEEVEYTKNILLPYAHMHHVEIQLSFKNSLLKKYDKNQIQQCLINLCKNGIEAMKEIGGTLMIAVSGRKNQIIIAIKDNGIGMTEDEISWLGKPYYSTKKHGTGLGMLMVYSTIHKMKGTIKVDSEKGKGTTFTLIIPV